MPLLKAAFGLVVVAGAAAAGLYLTDHLMAAQQSPRVQSAANQPLAVQTISLRTARFSDSVQAVGTARARKAVILVPEAGGRIAGIHVVTGAQVAQGDVLLELDDRAERADLKAAEATLAETQTAFGRQEQLNNSGSSSDAAFQTARAALLRAEAERDRATAMLENRSLRAPFAGVVGLTDLVEGQMVDVTTDITTLDDLDIIQVDFGVSESLLPRLKVGQRVDLTTAAWPDRVFQGKLERIDTRVDAATRSIALRATVANDDRALTGGMFLQARLTLSERQRPAIPEAALRVEGDQTLVLLAVDGTAREVQVTTGQQRDGLVEIMSDIDPDAAVIVTNLHKVEPGMAVAATPQDTPVRETAAAAGAEG